ncbi:MAG: hypothetical protein ACI9UR_002041 [Bacteroidia bacterium]|jgi:hypothetical protein
MKRLSVAIFILCVVTLSPLISFGQTTEQDLYKAIQLEESDSLKIQLYIKLIVKGSVALIFVVS